MHFAQIGVHRAQMAAGVGKKLDLVVADSKEPGLRVVGVGGQNRRLYEAQGTVCRCGAPIRPRGIGGTGAGGKDALVNGPVDSTPDDQHGHRTHPSQKLSPVDLSVHFHQFLS